MSGDMHNYRFILGYDGGRYKGWEHQPDTEFTIQGKLEAVLSRLTGEEIEVIGAGRTDAGVHARGMVANAHFQTELSETELRDYMNTYLPDDIAVREVKLVSDRFHSRYNAVGKTYRYTCYIGETKPLFDRKYVYTLARQPELEPMQEAAGLLTGEHDFMSFCSNPKMKKTTVRTVDRIDIVRKGSYLTFTYHGNGFLQHMVRIMTGTLLEVGFGERQPSEMTELLFAKQRALAGMTAPAQGLCHIKVDYQ